RINYVSSVIRLMLVYTETIAIYTIYTYMRQDYINIYAARETSAALSRPIAPTSEVENFLAPLKSSDNISLNRVPTDGTQGGQGRDRPADLDVAKRRGLSHSAGHGRQYFDFHLDTTRSDTSDETGVLIKARIPREPPSDIQISNPHLAPVAAAADGRTSSYTEKKVSTFCDDVTDARKT
ncbi:hypothetical protein ALC62_14068, partial [Cyphomyrmex costatus]